MNMRAVLDGEVMVFNEEDRPDFQKLQHYDDNRHLPLVYYVFDILSLNNKDLTDLPLTERKAILKRNYGKMTPFATVITWKKKASHFLKR